MLWRWCRLWGGEEPMPLAGAASFVVKGTRQIFKQVEAELVLAGWFNRVCCLSEPHAAVGAGG